MPVSFDSEANVAEVEGPSLQVVHVVRSDNFAGVERYVCDVVNELAARGHRAMVIGGEPTRMVAELDRTVLHVAAASTTEAFRALTRVGRVHLVHAHMTAAEAAALSARAWHRAPVVATRHFPDRRARVLPTFVGRLVREALAEEVAISRFVAAGIGEPSVVLYNGVRDRAAAALDARQVLMMQRLDDEKAPGVGLQAWAQSGLGRSGWRLAVAGTGRLETSLRALCSRLGVADTVRFLGRVADTEALLRESSIFLAPAYAEPFGLAVTEAMAHGLPVVAAAGGAHRETLGREGCFFAPGEPATAALHLLRLAEDPERRRTEGARGRQRQQSLFSLLRHVCRLEQLYLSIVPTPRGAA